MLAFQSETFLSIEDFKKTVSCSKDLAFVSQLDNHLPEKNETEKP